MKLATLDNKTRDGQLIVVSEDNQRYQEVHGTCLQSCLDQWSDNESSLVETYKSLNSGAGEKLDVKKLLSPLPRAYEWIDGSAYINHIVLVRRARGAEPPETLKTDPLVYQGGSGTFLSPHEDIPLVDESWGLDFESEVAVVLGDTPMGVKASEAHKYVRLIVLVNDVSLRNIVPSELKKGFGFFVSKPSSAFSPLAITPDELGEDWQEGRVHLPLKTTYNQQVFGQPNAGPEMHFSFYQLIEHVCQSRALTAGTIIGSGTVSNVDRSTGSSCLAEKRMLEKIDTGAIETPFMKHGDHVEIEMTGRNGQSLFGKISQKVCKM